MLITIMRGDCQVYTVEMREFDDDGPHWYWMGSLFGPVLFRNREDAELVASDPEYFGISPFDYFGGIRVEDVGTGFDPNIYHIIG